MNSLEFACPMVNNNFSYLCPSFYLPTRCVDYGFDPLYFSRDQKPALSVSQSVTLNYSCPSVPPDSSTGNLSVFTRPSGRQPWVLWLPNLVVLVSLAGHERSLLEAEGGAGGTDHYTKLRQLRAPGQKGQTTRQQCERIKTMLMSACG